MLKNQEVKDKENVKGKRNLYEGSMELCYLYAKGFITIFSGWMHMGSGDYSSFVGRYAYMEIYFA